MLLDCWEFYLWTIGERILTPEQENEIKPPLLGENLDEK